MPLLDRLCEAEEFENQADRSDAEFDPARWLYVVWPPRGVDEHPVGVIIQLTKSAHFQQNIAAMNEALLMAALRQHELREETETSRARLQVEVIERKKAEEALQGAQRKLRDDANKLEQIVAERTSQLKETVGELEAFSYTISHDLRAPLRALQGYAEMLLQDHGDALPPAGLDYLERISRAAKRLATLTMDVLRYSKVATPGLTLDVVELESLVRDILDDYPSFQRPATLIEIQGKLLPVLGDQASLTQVLSNLLGNAVKFVSIGVTPKIKIWTEAKGPNVRLWIQDNGIGIALKDQTRIFGMFERIYPQNRFEGTGIGLAIVRKAIERIGGKVGVISEEGKGSRFWIELKGNV